MRQVFKALALAAVCSAVLTGPLGAELRPVARPVPDAPMRPLARPVSQPVALAAAEAQSAAVPVETISTRSAPILPPAVLRQGRQPDLLAEQRMQPVTLRLLDIWGGASVPLRPDYLAVAAVQPMFMVPMRPSARPHQPWMDAVQISPGMIEEGGSAEDLGFTQLAVELAFRPPERPPAILARAEQVRAERARGALCGSVEIQGDALGRLNGRGACGIDNAVRVRSVAGVQLSTPARMDCTTARALLTWMRNGAIPAIGNTGGGLRSIRVVSEYACRTRNNQPGARLSEHSFGRAIDIAGFGLRDGTEITVLRGWNSSHGERLRRMWRAACGPFGTVLGPNANRYHLDHFHFDTARYRSGTYCR